MKGILIAVEGINGSGKSTIIKDLANYFRHTGETVSMYKFPDRYGKFGKQIDDHLQKKDVFKYKYDLLHAFAANRSAIKDKIIKDIMAGHIVICDRYVFSAIAYHIPLNASKATIKLYNDVIGYFDKHMPTPDITYLINGEHLHLRKETAQRYHYNSVASHQLYDIFKEVIKLNTNKYLMLKNEYDKLDTTVLFIINDINTRRSL